MLRPYSPYRLLLVATLLLAERPQQGAHPHLLLSRFGRDNLHLRRRLVPEFLVAAQVNNHYSTGEGNPRSIINQTNYSSNSRLKNHLKAFI